jgi:hypothetical protein
MRLDRSLIRSGMALRELDDLVGELLMDSEYGRLIAGSPPAFARFLGAFEEELPIAEELKRLREEHTRMGAEVSMLSPVMRPSLPPGVPEPVFRGRRAAEIEPWEARIEREQLVERLEARIAAAEAREQALTSALAAVKGALEKARRVRSRSELTLREALRRDGTRAAVRVLARYPGR